MIREVENPHPPTSTPILTPTPTPICLTSDKKLNQSLMKSYCSYLSRLFIQTSIRRDCSSFHNLPKLISCNSNRKYLMQIKYQITRVLLISVFVQSANLNSHSASSASRESMLATLSQRHPHISRKERTLH